MSDEKPAESTPAESAPPAASTPKPPPSILTKTSDLAPRPGFRAPANTRSKAQKKKR